MALGAIPMAILGTGTVSLPTLSSAAVAERMGVAEADLVRKTGILARTVAPPGARFGALGAEAIRRALAAAGLEAAALERIVFVNTTAGDDFCPATANHVARELGLARTFDGFDLNNACCGFLTALDLAARCVATGYGPIAIVAVEIFTRFVEPGEPRSYAIFGDAAAAAIVGPPRGRGAILASCLRNEPADIEAVQMKRETGTGKEPILRFGTSSAQMLKLGVELVVECVTEVLRRAETTVAELRWVAPHQPNGPMLDQLLAAIGVAPSQYVRVVHEQGSLGAASIVVGLDALLRSGHARPGDRGLLFALGAGASYGAMVIELDGAQGR
jgi:3-oxoacyl-(acyl-carrier-protein) synthase III